MKKVFTVIGVALVLFVVGVAVYVASRQHLKFEAPFPAVTTSADSAVIARGHYVVRSLAGCAQCHGDPSQMERSMAGEEVPLSGGFEFAIPPGKFYARNITPDPETGIGRFEDRAIARALRYGVGHDGRALLPFMEMQGLSDEDLTAVVSYLKSQPPVSNPVPAHKPNLLGRIVIATVLANPVSPKETPPTASPRGASVETGHYLVEAVANCWACHTERNMQTGQLVGARYSGGIMPDERNHKRTWLPPNITSEATTGRLAKFTEDEFVARFRAGRVIPESPMPWQVFRTMTDDDLRSVYRYLKTVPPVVRDMGPPFKDAP